MKLTTLLLLISILSACTKSDNKVNGDCDAKMIEKFKDEITCKEMPTSGPCNYLGKGIYEGKQIYFIAIICENCNTVPPQKGYNCEGEEIKIEDFNKNVTNTEPVNPKRKD